MQVCMWHTVAYYAHAFSQSIVLIARGTPYSSPTPTPPLHSPMPFVTLQKVPLNKNGAPMLGYIKVRPIISHAGHPLQNLGTRMSRALSVLVQQLASMLENCEAFTMPGVLQHFRNVNDAMLQQSHDTADWELGELDLEDMFLNIDKGLLVESYDYMIERLDQFVPPNQGRYRSRSRSVLFVSISTIDKKFYCLHRAPGTDVYPYIPVDCHRDFVDLELWFNNLFCAGEYVLSQHMGVPMGGKLSSQLSSLSLMCKGTQNTHISLFGSAVFHMRCKDNIYLAHANCTPFWKRRT